MNTEKIKDALLRAAMTLDDCGYEAPYIEDAVAELANVHEVNAELIAALDEIVDPIKYMRMEAEREGAQLHGGYAVQIADNPYHLRSIAKKALDKYNASQQPSEQHNHSMKERQP